MDDEFGADADFEAALAASTSNAARTVAPPAHNPPTPRIQQPTPQRLDKAPPTNNSPATIVHPKPKPLPQRSSGSSIQVSPRQRGNPILSSIRSFAWEYSDIPADY